LVLLEQQYLCEKIWLRKAKQLVVTH